MRKLVLVVHTSLDGFIANAESKLDGFESGKENLAFVADLTDRADAALFGRKSFELLEPYWPTAKHLPNATPGAIKYSRWYAQAQKIVLSSTLSPGISRQLKVISEDPINAVKQILAEKGKDIQIFGSASVAQLFMQHDLIDEYWIFINPVLFGSGVSIFRSAGTLQKLRLIESRAFPNGELALHYSKN